MGLVSLPSSPISFIQSTRSLSVDVFKESSFGFIDFSPFPCFQFHWFLLFYYFSSSCFRSDFFSIVSEARILDYLFYIIHNACIQCYKFLSKHLFHCIPNIFINDIFVLKILKFLSNLSQMCHLKYIISQILADFTAVFLLSAFNSTVILEQFVSFM